MLLKTMQRFIKISVFNISSAKNAILTGNMTAKGKCSVSHFLVM